MPFSGNRTQYLAVSALIVSMIIWSVSGIAIKHALLVLPPFTLIVLRFVPAVLLMLLVGLVRRKHTMFCLQKMDLRDLPLFLMARGLNPVHVLGRMMPAVLMALFTKSSAATLPVTMQSAENRLGVRKDIARFVLPICTTINMNGCAAFILVTSLFVMQNGGTPLTLGTILLWLLISVISAVGNAGVPMGCFFLTLSLMSGIGGPVAILGVILPIYTIIDMVETAENVWSDSCVCAMTDHDLK